VSEWPDCPGQDGAGCGNEATMTPRNGRVLCRDCWMEDLFATNKLASDEELERRFAK
jgi:hypothetical protein